MVKFKLISLILTMCFLSACAPSEQAIQTAIAKTQAALPTLTATATFTLRPTSIPTSTRVPPTRTKIPATHTPLPKPTYILETGWCMLSVGDVSGVDPKNVNYCHLDAREQIQLASNEHVTITLNNLDGKIEVYCALFMMDGTFIMSDVDIIGSGKVTCRP